MTSVPPMQRKSLIFFPLVLLVCVCIPFICLTCSSLCFCLSLTPALPHIPPLQRLYPPFPSHHFHSFFAYSSFHLSVQKMSLQLTKLGQKALWFLLYLSHCCSIKYHVCGWYGINQFNFQFILLVQIHNKCHFKEPWRTIQLISTQSSSRTGSQFNIFTINGNRFKCPLLSQNQFQYASIYSQWLGIERTWRQSSSKAVV